MILFKKEINEFGVDRTLVETKNVLIRFWSGKAGIRRFDAYFFNRGIEIGFYLPDYQCFARLETDAHVFGIDSKTGFYKLEI